MRIYELNSELSFALKLFNKFSSPVRCSTQLVSFEMRKSFQFLTETVSF